MVAARAASTTLSLNQPHGPQKCEPRVTLAVNATPSAAIRLSLRSSIDPLPRPTDHEVRYHSSTDHSRKLARVSSPPGSWAYPQCAARRLAAENAEAAGAGASP